MSFEGDEAFFASSTNDRNSYQNVGLASVIAQGISGLESTAAQIEAKTRKISLDDKKLRNGGKGKGSSSSSIVDDNDNNIDDDNHRQLAEGHRLMTIITEVLEELCDIESVSGGRRNNNHQNTGSLVYRDEPISILHVEVNIDLKHAKVFWTLPYSVLLDPRVYSNRDTYEEIMKTFEIDRGVATQGQKLLQKYVHSRLRFYYPPKLHLKPATENMVQQAIKELVT